MKHSVCPWWMGYALLNPMRKLSQNPIKILSPFLSDNARVVEIGSGMGFFTLPLAKLVGSNGKVYPVDLQEKMLSSLMKRAKKKGLSEKITPILVTKDPSWNKKLNNSIDFVLCFAVVHEIPVKELLFSQISSILKKEGKLLIAEPKGHVKKDEFDTSISIAQRHGLKIIDSPRIRGTFAVTMEKS